MKKDPGQPGTRIRVKESRRPGTIACAVKKSGRDYLLTCEHVLCNASRFCPAHPGTDTFGHKGVAIGKVAEAGGLTKGNIANDIDAALVDTSKLAKLVRGIAKIGTIAPKPVPLAEITNRMRVMKHGEGSGLTKGVVSGFHRSYVIHGKTKSTVVGLRRVIEIEPRYDNDNRDTIFCAQGDSGSLVVTDEKRPRAVGLLCARSGVIGRGYAVPIVDVLKILGCRLRP